MRSLTFADIKDAAAASGLPVVELRHLRQTSGGARSTSKAELIDALDGLFLAKPPPEQDRVARYMLTELLGRTADAQRDRLLALLERAGWHLVEGEPAPMVLRFDVPADNLPEPVRTGVTKAVRRFGNGDYDGAITSVVGLIDTITETIYQEAGLAGHRRAPFLERVVTAHRQYEDSFRTHLTGMSQSEADETWAARQRAVNGAGAVLAAFRRNFSDAHGATEASAALVQDALQSALFVIGCLRD